MKKFPEKVGLDTVMVLKRVPNTARKKTFISPTEEYRRVQFVQEDYPESRVGEGASIGPEV